MTISITNYSALDGKYTVQGTIGSGGFGKVKKGLHAVTGEKVAIKVMDKRNLGDDLPRAKLEIEALRDLDHQNICKMYEVVETESKIFMVLEHCAGGELFDYIVERDRLEESEARFIFRQIVAAVAYIHSQGYAHRDLKPENLLLDEEQNIKLIDFGLCARPKGGMGMQLETFCGSPAYAAPELISGKEYLGSEADIWSMGVLLFALLCGYLPFDDENMGTLYRKIQSGSYSCPHWLSDESRDLIGQMLQTHPKRRITVGGLLLHPWMHQGYRPCSIHWESEYEKQDLDDEVISELSLYFARSRRSIRAELKQWKYDYLTSTYLLLLLKKKRGSFFSLVPENFPLKTSQGMNRELASSLESGLNNAELLTLGSPKRESEESFKVDSDEDAIEKRKLDYSLPPPPLPPRSPALIHDTRFRVSDKENFAMPTCPPSGKKGKVVRQVPVTKQVQAHTQTSAKSVDPCLNDPATAGHTTVSVGHPKTSGPAMTRFQSPSLLPPADKRVPAAVPRAWESSDVPSILSPEQSSGGTPAKGTSARHRVFGSIEKGLDRVRNMLTPKRKGDPFSLTLSVPPSPAPTPRKIKVKTTGLYNVSVVGSATGGGSLSSPDAVLQTLQKALESKGIPCIRKGYILRNKLRNEQTGKVTLAFELEICRLQPPSQGGGSTPETALLGVCRKRLKGDAWIYKNVVEEVLKVLNRSA